MAPWYQRRIVGLDFETTGPDPRSIDTRIVQAALVVLDPDGTVHPSSWVVTVDPGCDIPAEATAVHGITTGQARDEGLPTAEVVARLADNLASMIDGGYPLVVYNAAFDITILAREMAVIGRHWPHDLRVIDPFICDKHLDRYRRGSRKLVDVAALYGVELGGDQAHDAMADAIAAGRTALAMAARHEVMRQDPMVLHDLQVGWHGEWATSFAEYLWQRGDTDVPWVPWPIPTRPALEVAA